MVVFLGQVGRRGRWELLRHTVHGFAHAVHPIRVVGQYHADVRLDVVLQSHAPTVIDVQIDAETRRLVAPPLPAEDSFVPVLVDHTAHPHASTTTTRTR